MPWFNTEKGRFWIGHHIKLGLILFDVERSTNPQFEKVVALFVVAPMSRWGYFSKVAVKTKLIGVCDFRRKYQDRTEMLAIFQDAYATSLNTPLPPYPPKPVAEKPKSSGSNYTAEDYGGGEPSATRAYDPGSGEYCVSIWPNDD
jgi:hypothetical protein